MSQSKVTLITDSLKGLADVKIIKDFESDASQIIRGKIELAINAETALSFEVIINPHYPLRSHDSETIRFINKELIQVSHVMGDGSICFHTSHNPDLKKKILLDVSALKNWAVRYYVRKETDHHYEHIIVPSKSAYGAQRCFLFTEVDYTFKKGDWGEIEYSNLATGQFQKDQIVTSIVQHFKLGKKIYSCKWNSTLKGLSQQRQNVGLFFFSEQAPAVFNRFAVLTWQELKPFLSQPFLEKLHSFEKEYIQKQAGTHLPLLIGYKTPDGSQIHWQAIMLEIGKFPIHGVKVEKNYYTDVNNSDIDWVLTRNCSASYFFGRGKLNENISTKKILIIGIGAIGSAVATTLARGGVVNLDLIDFDVKEPENICRSEYTFGTGLNNKTSDLSKLLTEISPFIEVKLQSYEFSECFNAYLKIFHSSSKEKKGIEKYLSDYDIIFDCSADNDLMYVLSKLNFSAELINLSITNHAKALVCGIKPNYYEFVIDQIENKLENDMDDLFFPTGCWNPTFKASYTDINVLVQFAIKHIDTLCCNKTSLRSFVLKTDNKNGLSIKLEQY